MICVTTVGHGVLCPLNEEIHSLHLDKTLDRFLWSELRAGECRRLISFVTMTMSSLYCLAGSQRVKCKLQAPSLSLTPNPIVPFIVQDAVLDKGDVDMQKKAALAEQLE